MKNATPCSLLLVRGTGIKHGAHEQAYARKDGLDENAPAISESDSPCDVAADGDSLHLSASGKSADFHAV